jgi:uncharacterized NAD-dependent epimerase/dehydratase family protein
MTIYSGLHDYLIHDPEFVEQAAIHHADLVDVRRNRESEVASAQGLNESCLRLHTVGQDCGVGKMLVSVELSRSLQQAGLAAKFIATGQTGILVEGDGCPVDSVVSDFVTAAPTQRGSGGRGTGKLSTPSVQCRHIGAFARLFTASHDSLL